MTSSRERTTRSLKDLRAGGGEINNYCSIMLAEVLTLFFDMSQRVRLVTSLQLIQSYPRLFRVVGKLEKNPNRSAALGQWIRALLSCHLGYLVSVPGLPEKLALLHQLIDRRVASFPKLLQLHGRLDLLLARAKSDGGGSRRRDGGRAMDAPEAVYREEDEEDEEGKDEEESEGMLRWCCAVVVAYPIVP